MKRLQHSRASHGINFIDKWANLKPYTLLTVHKYLVVRKVPLDSCSGA